MWRTCSRCGRIHDSNFQHKRIYYQHHGKEDELRNTNEWHKKSLEIRAAAGWLCEVCKDQGRYDVHDRLEVHHITKLGDDPEGLLDDSNLICLCATHHHNADNGELSADYLRRLAERRGG